MLIQNSTVYVNFNSAISGITLIGVPAEVYSDSALYLLVVPSLLIVCIIFSYFFLPIFYDLNVTCAYEVSMQTNQLYFFIIFT